MLKNYLLLIFSALCFISTACSSDVTDEEIRTSNDVNSQKENSYLTTKLNSPTTRAISSSPIETWTGDIKIEKKSKVKIAFSPAYMEYLPGAGVYICDIYTITARTPEDPTVVYKDAVDESCGFLPALKNPKKVSRGTKAYVSDDSENSYTLKTVCYRIISNTLGQTPNGEYYIPCRPEEAKIKYKKLHVIE
jgi:hypothetical protein